MPLQLYRTGLFPPLNCDMTTTYTIHYVSTEIKNILNVVSFLANTMCLTPYKNRFLKSLIPTTNTAYQWHKLHIKTYSSNQLSLFDGLKAYWNTSGHSVLLSSYEIVLRKILFQPSVLQKRWIIFKYIRIKGSPS